MAAISLTIPHWDILLELNRLGSVTVETLLLAVEPFTDEVIDSFRNDLRGLAAAGLLTLDGPGDDGQVELTEAGGSKVERVWRQDTHGFPV